MTGVMREWAKSSSAGAVILAVANAYRGFSYYPVSGNAPPIPPHWFERLLTYPVWGGVWFLVAALCVYAALDMRLVTAAVTATMAIHAASAAAVFMVWIANDPPGNWWLSLEYAIISFLVLWAWGRGKSGTIRIKG